MENMENEDSRVRLEVGEPAPAFTTTDQHGKSHSMADYLGKKVILYFYPKDDTPGCTAQSCNLRDNYAMLQGQGYEVLGISTDDQESHARFATKFDLPFTLLVDTDHAIGEAYGTYGPKKTMFGKNTIGTSRTTFVIDEQGVITRVIRNVKTKDHTTQVLQD